MTDQKIDEKSADSKSPSAEAPAQSTGPAADNYYDQLLRLKAEFENYRKRVDKERPEYYKLGRADLLLKFLPIYDLLRLAHDQIQASHAETEFAKGMDGIFKEFEKIFKEEGVGVMEPMGKPYDPLRHDVLGTVQKDGAADGEVVDVLQAGYQLGDKVLRPAKVRIAKSQEK